MGHFEPRSLLLVFVCLIVFGSQVYPVEVPIDQYAESAVGLEWEQISGTIKY